MGCSSGSIPEHLSRTAKIHKNIPLMRKLKKTANLTQREREVPTVPANREVAACATARKAHARSRGGSSATASGSFAASASSWDRWSPTDSAAASVSSAADTTEGRTAEAASAEGVAMVCADLDGGELFREVGRLGARLFRVGTGFTEPSVIGQTGPARFRFGSVPNPSKFKI